MTTTPAHIEALVVEVTEAECRRLMAMRAAIRLRWDTRLVRADLLAQVIVLLDEYNLLTLGR